MVKAGRNFWRPSGPTPSSSTDIQSQLPRTMFRWLLEISREGGSKTSLGNLCQFSLTHTEGCCSPFFSMKLLLSH